MESLYTDFEYNKLDFDKILLDISYYTLSEIGKEQIINTIPENNIKKVNYNFKILNQLINFIINEEKLTVNIIYNFKDSLINSKKNITISEIDLYKLSYSVKLYFTIQYRLKNPKYPELKKIFKIDNLESKFYIDVLKYFDHEGNISSNISLELKKVRQSILNLNDKISKITQSFYQTAKKSNYISEDIISLRDGFNCIAIKSNFKNKLDGIIIDSSSSGQTVFIVPNKVIELHNELIILKEEEKKVIRKILHEYTLLIKDNYYELSSIDNDLIDFDIFFSKAKYSLKNELNIPEIINEKKLNILSGRHPLLGKKAIPLDIKIGEDYKIIIVTGPNTGGKTVVLKTVGLFVLMIQSGIPIPASSSSKFCIFNKVFVDIGDEQSIVQSLSTFSAHIKKIIEVIKNADENSLILFDEFCAGTDPTEGSALAISLLNKIIKLKSIAITTTHYSALKYFASQHDGIENASMEFDSERLMPLYKLNIGIPGNSKALEISKRVGMPQDIIDNAKKNINKDYLKIEKISENLEKEKRDIEILKNKLIEESEKLKKENNFFLKKQEEIEQKEKQLNDESKINESLFLKKSRKEFEQIIKEIKTKNASKESIKKGKELFDNIDKNIKKDTQIKKKKIINQFNIGDEVLIISKDIKGIILEKSNKKDEYLVQAGLIKMNFNAIDLKLILSNSKENFKSSYKTPEIKTQLTLDLRGCRYGEAEKKLDKFIENSLINSVSSIRIIHGKGTGALKRCIYEYFEHSPFIIDFDYEKSLNGNSTNYGVTIAFLR
jgi:DNA mismatch repair protein MutS2